MLGTEITNITRKWPIIGILMLAIIIVVRNYSSGVLRAEIQTLRETVLQLKLEQELLSQQESTVSTCPSYSICPTCPTTSQVRDKPQIVEQHKIERLKRNVTLPGLIIYNRVPKCGSTTMRWLIDILKARKKFNVIDEAAERRNMESEEIERSFIKRLIMLDKPVIYIRHVLYLRFYELFHQHPVYINIVRDPVDMFVSSYYYRRFGHHGEKAQPGQKESAMPDEVRYMSIGECIEKKAEECTVPKQNLIPYFCGSSAVCRQARNCPNPACRSKPPSEEAVKIAKKRLQEEYMFIGLTEDMPNTMRALEKLLPKFFQGAAEIYRHVGSRIHKQTKTKDRKEPTQADLIYLRDRMPQSYELYKLAKELFYEKLKTM